MSSSMLRNLSSNFAVLVFMICLAVVPASVDAFSMDTSAIKFSLETFEAIRLGTTSLTRKNMSSLSFNSAISSATINPIQFQNFPEVVDIKDESLKGNRLAATTPSRNGRARFETPFNLQTTSFVCAPPIAYSPSIMCSGIVDYSYVLPSGASAEDMNNWAISSATGLSSFMNSACLSDLKRLICANVYLPCATGITPDDPSTYPLLYGAIPFPYKRPCESICTSVLYSGNSCAGLLEGLGSAPDCLAIDPMTTLPQYDSSNSPTQCNNLESSVGAQLVSSASEPYIGKVCSGVVTEYYVPPPSQISPLLAPLQPPFVLQSIVEQGLVEQFKTIPKFLHPECQAAQHEIYCSLSLMSPHTSMSLAFIFGPVTIPSFPSKDVCLNYNDKCSEFIKNYPDLAMDCDMQIAPGLKLFPETQQTIAELNLGFGPIYLTSPPFDPNITATYETECPYAFGVPTERVTNKNGIIVGGMINCAVKCPFQVYTKEELTSVYDVLLISSYIVIVVCAFTLFNLLYISPTKNSYVIVLTLSSVIDNFLPIVESWINGGNWESITCSGDMEWYTMEDNTSESNSCMTFLVISALITWVFYWVMISVSVELWLKVVWSIKDVTFYRYFYMYGSALLVLANALLTLFDKGVVYNPPGNFGGPTIGGMCSFELRSFDRAFELKTIPHAVYLAFSLILGFHVIYICLKISLSVSKEGENTVAKLWSTYRMMFLLLALELAVFPVLIYWFELVQLREIVPVFVKSTTDWTICLFENFLTSADESYLDICGIHPKKRMEPGSLMGTRSIAIVVAFLIFLITMNPQVRAFWSKHICVCFNPILDKINYLVSTLLGLEKDNSNNNSGKGVLVKPSPGPVPVANFSAKVAPITVDVENARNAVEMGKFSKEALSPPIPAYPPIPQSDAISDKLASSVAELVEIIKTTSASAAAMIGIGDRNKDYEVAGDETAPPGTPESEDCKMEE